MEILSLVSGPPKKATIILRVGLNKFLRTRGLAKKGAVLFRGALLAVGLQTQGGRVTKQKPVLADQEIHKVLFAGLPADCIADNQDQTPLGADDSEVLLSRR